MGDLKGIAKASADLLETTSWVEFVIYYCLYSLGLLAHYYPLSLPVLSLLIIRSRLKIFSKSCAILGVLYIIEQRLSLPFNSECCSDFYYVSTGAQIAKLLPAFFLLLLGSRAFRNPSFSDSLDFAHSGQVAAFFQIFPSYSHSVFDLFEQDLTLATFASLVLISAVTFGNYRSVVFIYLRRVCGRYCLVAGSLGLNLAFLYFDFTIRGMRKAALYWVLREAWSVIASYEVECIYMERQTMKRLNRGLSCVDLLVESNSHPFLTLPPQWSRRRLQIRFLRLVSKHAHKIEKEDLKSSLRILHASGAVASQKTKVLLLRTLITKPDVDLFLLIKRFEPDYNAQVQGPLRFLEVVRQKVKLGEGDVETLRRIEEFVSRREAPILGLLWLYHAHALRGVQKLSLCLFREMTFYIA